MENTALIDLINYIKETPVSRQTTYILKKAEELLDKEEKQIAKAFVAGSSNINGLSSRLYYHETFNKYVKSKPVSAKEFKNRVVDSSLFIKKKEGEAV